MSDILEPPDPPAIELTILMPCLDEAETIGGCVRAASDYLKRANIQGISVGSTQMFEALNRVISANGIKPVIDKVFGFDEVHAAYKHMATGAHFGKIVIHVA